MRFKTIAIIGLGLMGGSLAAACRRRFPNVRIIGITRDKKASREALKKRWIHESAKNLSSGVAQADLIVLCTPVDTFVKMLSSLDLCAPKGALVTDVGSVKGEVDRWVKARKFRNIQFVGAHPMTGSHERGITAARPDLYEHGFTFVVKPSLKVSPAFKEIFNFWKKISPRVVAVSAEEHDKIVSEISHLPHAAAVCLVNAVSDRSVQFAAGGFSDATRVAQGHPSVWIPIFRANKKSVLTALKKLEDELRAFRKVLSDERFALLQKMLEKAAKKRSEISF